MTAMFSRRRPGRCPRTGVGLLLLLLSLLAAPAWGFVCNGSIVSEGMTPYEVILYCGKPDYQETVRIDDYGFKVVKTDMWFYNCGSNRLIYKLTVREGQVVKIETGEYGRGPARCY